MENQHQQMLNEIMIKTAKIEANLDNQKETLDRIEANLAGLDEMKQKVGQHGLIIKAYTWILGIIVSFFTAKFLGKI